MVRELFIMAREASPSIIFMDEIDSIGSTRMEGGSGGGDSEVQRTMLELLNQLDGFEPVQNIKVIVFGNSLTCKYSIFHSFVVWEGNNGHESDGHSRSSTASAWSHRPEN